jgi:hypothetical protein
VGIEVGCGVDIGGGACTEPVEVVVAVAVGRRVLVAVGSGVSVGVCWAASGGTAVKVAMIVGVGEGGISGSVRTPKLHPASQNRLIIRVNGQ